MKRNLKLTVFALLALFGVVACLDLDNKPQPDVFLLTPELPAEPYNYAEPELPAHFVNALQTFPFNNTFSNVDLGNGIPVIDPIFGDISDPRLSAPANPIVTNDGATLGRVLFYDPQMSVNNSISCASCHFQEAGFADPRRFSKGFGGKITPRNSMSIVNPGFNNHLFWDSRATSVTDLVLQPVQNHIEMGMEKLDVLEQKIARVEYYPELFQKAFGDSQVTRDRISSALSQFLCSMVTTNSRFDQGVQSNFDNYTTMEKMGKDLFFSERTQCSGCHSGVNFAAPDFPGGDYGAPEVKGSANIGLDLVYKDNGLGNGKFRIPSLRNIELSAPYMHDGRFANLEEVVNHYNSGIQAHSHLDDKLKGSDGLPRRMNLSGMEKQALIAFLKTLTDRTITQDQKFSSPFN